MEDHDNMDYFYQQVLQKDVTRRLQVGQDLVDFLNDPNRSPDVEQDKPRLDKTMDELTGWVNSSNFKVRESLASHHMRVSHCHCSSHPLGLYMNYFSSSLSGAGGERERGVTGMLWYSPRGWFECDEL